MRTLEQQVSDEAVAALRELHAQALKARRAATDMAAGAFSGEPLPGIGGETWRRMFVAASEYASEVGAPAIFSALAPDSVCPLCQQTLEENARKRITRFQEYVSGHLSHVAEQAEIAYNGAFKNLCDAALHPSADFDARLKQLELRSAGLAVLVRDWLGAYRNRHAHLISGETGLDTIGIPPMPHQIAHESLASLAEALRKERETLTDLAEGTRAR
jgi:hypothetical protein